MTMTTLTKYLLLILASCIGVLLVMFRIQGGKLHKLQLQVLSDAINKQIGDDEAVVAKARAAFQKALEAYHAANRS